MTTKTLGYIVVQNHSALWSENRKSIDASYHGILFFSREATLFPSRRQAQRAIELTKRHRSTVTGAVNFGAFRIQRVVAP
jgi:hypothetical protein